MSHRRINLVAVFSRNGTSTADTSTAIVPAQSSSSAHNIGQTTSAPRPVIQLDPPIYTVLESMPDVHVDHTHAPRARRGVVVRSYTKLRNAVSRRTAPAPTPPTIHPTRPPVHFIGPAIMVSSFVAAAPLHALSVPPSVFDSAPGDDMHLSEAKTALRVLSALGDGIAGVPWLKGAAALGLEIVNASDVSCLARSLTSVHINSPFAHGLRMSGRIKVTAESWHSKFATF